MDSSHVRSLKSWNGYLNLAGTQENKLSVLAASNLGLKDPQNQRSRIWIELVSREYGMEVLYFYKEISAQKKLSLPTWKYEKLKQEAANSFLGPLAPLEVPGSQQKVVNLLSIFCQKRPDIDYHQGMNFIAVVTLSVFSLETDAFLIFCHIVEKVFPQGFFSSEKRQLVLERELTALSLMAKDLLPELVTALQAVFVPENSSKKQSDITPFTTTVKKLGEVLFKSLFSTVLMPQDLLRVWDNLLIHGFEFVHKFCLVLVTKNQKFLKNCIKQETKALGVGPSVDALVAAGNYSLKMLVCKVEKFGVESMIKKAISKKEVKSLMYKSYLEQAQKLQKNNFERIERLRRTNYLLEQKDFETVLEICSLLDTIQSNNYVSRESFLNSVKKHIEVPLALNIFVTIDQLNEGCIELKSFKVGIILLSSQSVSRKLQLCFEVFDEEKKGVISIHSATSMIFTIERSLDFRSNTLRKNQGTVFRILEAGNREWISKELLTQVIIEDSLISQVLVLINCVHYEQPEAGGHYEEIHSPVKTNSENYQEVSSSETEESQEELETSIKDIEDKMLAVLEDASLDTDSFHVEFEPIYSSEKASTVLDPIDLHPKVPRSGCSRNCSRDFCCVF